MINIKPFRGLRANKDFCEKIVEYPYDVLSAKEIKQIVKKNPLSFYKISRAESEFEECINPYSDEVYNKAKKNFQEFIEKGYLVRDNKKCMYLYRQTLGGFSQTGIIGVIDVDDFTNGRIKKHENTLTEKENDRIRHIEELNAQTGPVFLTYNKKDGLDRIILEIQKNKPENDFTTEDKVTHTFWIINDEKVINDIIKEFNRIDYLYIADGHHRANAAKMVAQKRKSREDNESNYIMSIIYSHDSLRILPYNRAVKDLNGNTVETFLNAIKINFDLEEINSSDTEGGFNPFKKGQIGMYLDNKWFLVKPKDVIKNTTDPVLSLDVSILQKYILDGILRIVNPRTDKRIEFFGGNKSTSEIKKMVDNGEFKVMFSMYPTSIDELIRVSDAGLLMPPKSTWFDPKPRSGFVIHQLD